MSEWSDAEVRQRIKREIERQRNMPAFHATKFDREYAVCDHDSGMFDIPFPPVVKHADEQKLRTMRDALQKAWIIFDGLRSYRDDAELLAILRSSQMEDAREAVRRAAMISFGGSNATD